MILLEAEDMVKAIPKRTEARLTPTMKAKNFYILKKREFDFVQNKV